MPENRRKRPRDPAQLAKLMIDIASGEVEDRPPTPEEQGKDPGAAALGRAGESLLRLGLARPASCPCRRGTPTVRMLFRASWQLVTDATDWFGIPEG